MKRQIFTNERRRAVKRSLKMKFRVDVTRVVPLLPRKGVDSSTCWYYTRVFLNLGPSLPPRTLCKYSNGTANGAPLFDSLKTARSKEIGSRKLRLKFYFTSFNFSSRVTRVLLLSLSLRLGPVLSRWSLTSRRSTSESARNRSEASFCRP